MFGLASHMTLVFMAAAFCALIYLAACARPRKSWLKSVVKTLAVLLLALVALTETNYMLLAVALTCCAVGDFFLSRDGEEAFMSGIGAFAIGHLAYIVLFALHPRASFERVLDGWPLALALGLLGVLMMGLLFRRAGALRWPVMAYIPIILGMGIAAMALPFDRGLALILPAALLFVISDFILAQEMFVLSETHKLRRITPYAIWITYWLAQALFLIAFLTA